MPLAAAPIAYSPATDPMLQRVAAGERQGMLDLVSSEDHARRLTAFHRIGDTPLYAAALRRAACCQCKSKRYARRGG